jgi:putative membrane-bound dehydrogenase-like protein
MKWLTVASALLAVAISWGPGAGPEARKTHMVPLNGHTFTLPVSFEIEIVAGPPLVDRPIVADFDEEGRLYVADSSGSNEKVQEQLKKKPHRIVRLVDTDGDGRFDKQTVFADHMMFPEGCMWYAGSLYVSAAPSIWKLTDTDGDGVADQRSEWFEGKTLTGCANDLHGPYAGPDGWIYWCKGAFAKQTYERPGQSPLVTRAAHIFRCRPDGSGVEPVMTGGMDNPVDVVFTPGGERIFTTTFLQFPGGGRRDGLIHDVYGGIYGKDWDVLHEYEHKWTGPAVMPVLVHMGAAAPCGLTRYASPVFGPEYRDNVFACQFNMQKVSRHVLVPNGATFTTRDEDFLVSDNKDFHPTDVLEDADGSLLVIDTGGWYKLCCPTSQLVKPDVLGAIYRVRRTGAPRPDDPRGLKLDWKTMSPAGLAGLLADARPVVRRRAVQVLGEKGAAVVPVLAETLRTSRSAQARRNAVWAATRINDTSARAAVRAALVDADETVRQVALHSISLWRDRGAASLLMEGLENSTANISGKTLPTKPSQNVRNAFAGSPHNQRAAAEALGRIGDKAAVPALLAAAGLPGDRMLEHSLTFALIEIGDAEATAAGLKSANLRTRRAALTALDQMARSKLQVAAIAAELASPDPALKETAWWIAGRHPEWGGALAGFLRDRLAAKDVTATEREEWARQLARFARSTAVQELLAEQLRDAAAAPDARRTVLRAMAQSGVKEAPAHWIAALVQVLATHDGELTREAVVTVRALRLPKTPPEKLGAALLLVARDAKVPAGVRLDALAAVPGGLKAVEPPLFDLLRANLAADQAVGARSAAADVLARARLTPDQLLALTVALKAVGPMEINRLVEAFAVSSDEHVGQSLLAALKTSPARSALRWDALKSGLAKSSAPVRQQAEELFASLNADTAKQKTQLEQLLTGMKDGDIRRGQAVFNSAKAACSACHAIGYLGGNIGPDLTHIARIRSERDLLEAIVFPSASFVRGYEPVVVSTRDGKVHNGVIRRDTADELVLATGANQEVRIARGDIEELQPSRVSVMPAGLDQQLTPRDLADLVAFLKACK